MDIEEDLKILQEFTELDRKLRNYKVESDYDNFCERRCVAIDNLLAEREEDKKKIKELEEHQQKFYNGEIYTAKQLKQVEENQKKYFINKQKVKEELEKAKKENEPYEIHNKESRMFWINQGKIRLAKKLLEDK